MSCTCTLSVTCTRDLDLDFANDNCECQYASMWSTGSDEQLTMTVYVACEDLP